MRSFVLVATLALAGCQSMGQKYGTAWLIKSSADRTSGVIGSSLREGAPEEYSKSALKAAAGCPDLVKLGAMERKTSQRLVTVPWTIYGAGVVPLTSQVTDAWFEIEFQCVGREIGTTAGN